MDNGIDTEIARGGTNISGGQNKDSQLQEQLQENQKFIFLMIHFQH